MTPMASASAFVLVRNARKPSHAGPRSVSARRPWAGRLRLGDPAGDLGLARHPADHVRAGRVDLLERDREVRGVALGELGRRVDAGGLEQVGVLRADALDPHQVDVVDPLEDVRCADPGRLLDGRRPPAWRPRRGAPRWWRRRPAPASRPRRPDALDLVDLHRPVPPSCRRRTAAPRRPDDTLAACPRDTPPRPGGPHGQGVPRRDDGRLRADRAGPRASAARCTTASSPTTPASRSRCRCSTATASSRAPPGRARPRRSSCWPASCRRPACRSSWPTSRAT